jgi:hypothetical protein
VKTSNVIYYAAASAIYAVTSAACYADDPAFWGGPVMAAVAALYIAALFVETRHTWSRPNLSIRFRTFSWRWDYRDAGQVVYLNAGPFCLRLYL